MNYERDTRLAYDSQKARSYKNQQTKDFCWARIATWRERVSVRLALKCCGLQKEDRILDIPCGSGIMADILLRSPCRIVASDISYEMIKLAKDDYKGINFNGFVKSDITHVPFKAKTFSCVVLIGLLHRLPMNVRSSAIKEVVFLSKRFIIVSYSLDSSLQRIKQFLLKKVSKTYKSAPSPVKIKDILNELTSNDLFVKKMYRVVPLFSAEIIVLLEKKH